MHIVVAGLNYRTAPVSIREKFTFAEGDLPLALQELKATRSVMECVIVGTCNRTELYVAVDTQQLCANHLKTFIEKWFQVPKEQFNKHLYIYENEQAIEHLLRVTSGLDSMVIGETQILGQVRDAFLLAQQLKTTGVLFNTLFKQAVTMAKRAHFETGIGDNPVSVSYAAVELGKRIFGTYENKKVLIIGAGKMSELTVKHLCSSGASKVTVVNRTLSRAAELAERFGGVASTMDKLGIHLEEADIVISSTGSAGYVLTAEQVSCILQRRRSRPLFMMDIAVPRDLDPRLGELPNVFLYDIDNLQSLVNAHMEERHKAAVQIEAMIKNEMAAFEQWSKTLGISPVIQALQSKASVIHEETMDSLMKKLPELDERELKVISKLTKSIVNQMLRDPIVRIKEMAAERHGDEALDMFTKIFALEEQLDGQKRAEQELRQREAEAAQERAKEELLAKVRVAVPGDILAKA
ncbi:glutamyl-tRNA reductase [Paenibacillus sp. UNCCL117]|uniref:glutamyl-tRNA reductase n=1 Tax=unclassified Paenibacillus TaxID=185978 RepID=UPI000885B33E|nr:MULTISPECIES: glutamyl-tRNA reductase [unclassified Paenibacillus]SDD25367.1 glutamyl-tRNA reductase [Paenibacillus sp. cl123]SFW41281.1 glutamyl-tRNA reductase [Paenibacillus sp. UNCCL117]